MNWRIKNKGKGVRTIQYPVNVRRAMSARDDIGSRNDYIFACTKTRKAMNRSLGSTCQIISDIESISSEKQNASEQVTEYLC